MSAGHIVASCIYALGVILAIAAVAAPQASVSTFGNTYSMTLSQISCSGPSCQAGYPVSLADAAAKCVSTSIIGSQCYLLTSASDTAKGATACYAIGIILAALATTFSALTAAFKLRQASASAADAAATSGCFQCTATPAASIVPGVFAFILFIVGTAMSNSAALQILLVYFPVESLFSAASPSSGYGLGIASIFCGFVGFVVDASVHCRCSSCCSPPQAAAAAGGVVLTVVTGSSEQPTYVVRSAQPPYVK